MSAKDVLSKDEIDALLDKADTIAANRTPPHLRDEVEPYDIFKPPQMRSANLPDVSALVDAVIEKLPFELDQPLPKLLKMRSGPDPELLPFEEFRQTLDTPCAMLGHALSKPQHAMLFALSAAALQSLVSVQFGGDGSASDAAPGSLTGIQLRVAGKLLECAANLLTRENREAGVVRDLNTNPANLLSPGDDESMLVIRMDLEIGAGGGELIIAGTSPAISQILGNRKKTPNKDSAQWQSQLFQRATDATLTVCGRAAEARMDIGELLRLAPGDFIPMDIDRSVTLCVDDLPLLRGLLGVSGAATAIHIVGPANDPENRQISFSETITSEAQ